MGQNHRQEAKACLTAFALLLAFTLPWLGYGLACLPPRFVSTDAAAQPQGKLIALTFDDGPRRETTTVLLDGLKQRGVPATFFLIGEQIPGNEDLLRRMAAEGHQIGIHSYTHQKLTGLNDTDWAAEVDRTRLVIQNAVGPGDYFLRPPYGLTDPAVLRRADRPIILWSVDPEDWAKRNTAATAEHLLSHARDGAILLLHDIYPSSVEAALQVVDELHRQGYYFLTVEQLFAQRGIPLEAGKIYRNAYPASP